MKNSEVIIDGKGRIDLSRVRKQDHRRYLACETPDGVITLTPLATARIPRIPLPDAETETAGL